jgi:radical SAM protein with 4Fe4S-binding SPASM domain
MDHVYYRDLTFNKSTDPLSLVEINLTDFCNRRCSFCPHSGPFHYGVKESMSISTAATINQHLLDLDFKQTVSFCGFGEPLFADNFVELVNTLTNNVDCKVELDTNCDFVTREVIEQTNITHLVLSMYDEDVTKQFEDMFEDSKVTLVFKHFYDTDNMFIVNRDNIMNRDQSLDIGRPCHLPFSKMFIDWDGSVLLCANDWSKKSVVGNINEDTIEDIWMNDRYRQYREMLLEGRRDAEPCNKCNIDGTLFGQKSFDYFKDLYK